jgi:hypothetical protein
LPDAYHEGFDEIVVIGVFDEKSQAGRFLRLVQRLDRFDADDTPFIDALMDVVREVTKNEKELERSTT